MNRRIIIVLVAIVGVLLYNQSLPKVEDFDPSILRETRPVHRVLETPIYEDGVLVFSEDVGLAMDYYKPAIMSWDWVYGSEHSGDYDLISYQYIPKAGLKDMSMVFGRVVSKEVTHLIILHPDGSKRAEIQGDIWYVILENEEPLLTLQVFSDDTLLETVEIDSSWLFNN